MDILEKLWGSKIAVIGLGYLGKRLNNFLKSHSEKFSYSVHSFSRTNIAEIKGVEFDYVFNCAGNTGDFRNKIWETVDSNLFLTHFLLNNIKINKAYISSSSSRVYGFSDNPGISFSESYLCPDISDHLSIDFIYDGTKKLQESILFNIGKNSTFRLISCRLSNVYGRYIETDMNNSTFLKVMISHAVEKHKLVISQNPYSSKGFVFIDDAILGLIHSAVNSTKSAIYNICSGVSYSIEDWVNYLNLDVEFVETGDKPKYSNISIAKAVEELNFQPTFFLNQLKINTIYERSH